MIANRIAHYNGTSDCKLYLQIGLQITIANLVANKRRQISFRRETPDANVLQRGLAQPPSPASQAFPLDQGRVIATTIKFHGRGFPAQAQLKKQPATQPSHSNKGAVTYLVQLHSGAFQPPASQPNVTTTIKLHSGGPAAKPAQHPS